MTNTMYSQFNAPTTFPVTVEDQTRYIVARRNPLTGMYCPANSMEPIASSPDSLLAMGAVKSYARERDARRRGIENNTDDNTQD